MSNKWGVYLIVKSKKPNKLFHLSEYNNYKMDVINIDTGKYFDLIRQCIIHADKYIVDRCQKCDLLRFINQLELDDVFEEFEDKNEHVYCTNCIHFRLDDELLPYCMYENKCNINDCEDSKKRKYRPFYEEKGE